MKYRVVYGETRPSWHKDFTTWKATAAFLKRRIDCGDTIFKVGEAKEIPPGLAALLLPPSMPGAA